MAEPTARWRRALHGGAQHELAPTAESGRPETPAASYAWSIFFCSTGLLAMLARMAARMDDGISAARYTNRLQWAFERLHELNTRGVIAVNEGPQEAALRAMREPLLLSNAPEIPSVWDENVAYAAVVALGVVLVAVYLNRALSN